MAEIYKFGLNNLHFVWKLKLSDFSLKGPSNRISTDSLQNILRLYKEITIQRKWFVSES